MVLAQGLRSLSDFALAREKDQDITSAREPGQLVDGIDRRIHHIRLLVRFIL